MDSWQLFLYSLSGGLAGLTVDLVYYPLETIKTRIMGSSVKENLVKEAQSISKFRGMSCQMIVSFPYSFIFFLVYGQVRKRLEGMLITDFIAAALGQGIANITRNPLELVKQRLMVGREHTIRQSLKSIMQKRGFLGFYTGYTPTLLRDVIFSTIQMPMYQKLRKPVGRTIGKDWEHPLVHSLAGSISAFISAFLTCPFDVIKTRHMTMTMSQKQVSFSEITRILLREQGLAGFFKGVHYRCLILTFGGILYFYAFGSYKRLLKVQNI